MEWGVISAIDVLYNERNGWSRSRKNKFQHFVKKWISDTRVTIERQTIIEISAPTLNSISKSNHTVFNTTKCNGGVFFSV